MRYSRPRLCESLRGDEFFTVVSVTVTSTSRDRLGKTKSTPVAPACLSQPDSSESFNRDRRRRGLGSREGEGATATKVSDVVRLEPLNSCVAMTRLSSATVQDSIGCLRGGSARTPVLLASARAQWALTTTSASRRASFGSASGPHTPVRQRGFETPRSWGGNGRLLHGGRACSWIARLREPLPAGAGRRPCQRRFRALRRDEPEPSPRRRARLRRRPPQPARPGAGAADRRRPRLRRRRAGGRRPRRWGRGPLLGARGGGDRGSRAGRRHPPGRGWARDGGGGRSRVAAPCVAGDSWVPPLTPTLSFP